MSLGFEGKRRGWVKRDGNALRTLNTSLPNKLLSSIDIGGGITTLGDEVFSESESDADDEQAARSARSAAISFFFSSIRERPIRRMVALAWVIAALFLRWIGVVG